VIFAAAHAAFNANFYVVAATVHPVLFLALVIPGGPLQRQLSVARSTPPRLRPTATFLSGSLIVLFTAAFAVGEYVSILALDSQHAPSAAHVVALSTLLVMVLETAALTALCANFEEPND
jgi:hypothetical protein